jgi:4-amino-4-deoxy-L-arabinose transferase-like glycosyltransferase
MKLDRLSERQMALLVIGFGLLLYLPFAGSYGLWDPWETHYSEVARQMTRRADYISLWWPGSWRETPVFQTKPVLSFWLMSLGMRIAGIGLPGGDAAEMALGHRAEWAVRTPFCLLGALGLYGVYLVTSRLARPPRRRAGRARHRHLPALRARRAASDDGHGLRRPHDAGPRLRRARGPR